MAEKIVYNPDLVGDVRKKLSSEADDSTSLSDVIEGIFGGGHTGKVLLKDTRDATQHVNATLKKLNDGLEKYSLALKKAADHIKDNDDEIAADARYLTAGLSLIQTPFYKNKHGKPDAPPPPLLPWGRNKYGPFGPQAI